MLEHSKEDLEIIKKAQGFNRGDAALGNAPDIVRGQFNNRAFLRGNVLPNDIINRNNPTANYQFAWVPFTDSDFFNDLKEDGYVPVIESEWVLTNEAWKWSVAKQLVRRDTEFAMYRNEDAYRREMERRANFNERNIAKRMEEGTDDANRLGLTVEGEFDGKKFVQEAGRKKVSVS